MAVDGTFYPCARFGSKKLLPMKGEEYNFDYFQSVFNPLAFDKCKGCRLYKVCNAGCTFSQLRNGNQPIDSVCELFHIYYDEAIRMVEVAKDIPTFQTYIKTIWGGRTGFYEPNKYVEGQKKIDMFEMIDKAWQKNEKYKVLTNFKTKTEEKVKPFDHKDYNSTLAFLQSKEGHNIKKMEPTSTCG